MRYLVAALVAEGPTDERFLVPVIRQAVIDRLRSANELVELQEQFLTLPGADRLLGATTTRLRDGIDGFDLLFVHVDGKGQPGQKRGQSIDPIFSAFADVIEANRLGCAAVVPVHETEAWALADADALRGIFGSSRPAHELGLPSDAGAIERLADPKTTLREVCRIARGNARRRLEPPPLALSKLS